eukprot:187807_1
MDVLNMDTIPTRNRAWTLPQSNTGLCNITNHNSSSTYSRDALYRKKHRKHKTNSNKRRQKKHSLITTKKTVPDGVNIARRHRSSSRPRLSQANLSQLEDKEISAKRKKKEEFLVHRSKLHAERRQSQPLDDALNTKHVKRQHKHKKLGHIREHSAAKPSTNKKHKKGRKKRRATQSDAMYRKYEHDDIEHNTKKKKSKKKRNSDKDRITTDTNKNTNANAKPLRERRRKKRDRAQTRSHGIDLNELNQLIKEQSQSTNPPKQTLSNHRSYKAKTKAKARKVLDDSRFYQHKRKSKYNRLLNQTNDTICGRGRSKSEWQKPRVCIDHSPSPSSRGNEVVFIGYRAHPGPTYRFRGKGKLEMDYEEDEMAQQTPSPPEDRFTFKHITSKYKPHRIQWSTCATNEHQRAKTMQINRILAELLSDEEDDNDEDLSVVSDSQTSEQSEGGELLFDVDSFVTKLTNKRAKQKLII